jgi:Tfp pilus assembly protein PilX
MNVLARQGGATLVVSLILLVVLTLLVLATLATSNTNLRIVSNMQVQRQLEAAAQKGIEDRITDLAFFQDAIDDAGVWADGVASIAFVENAYAITLFRPTCIYTTAEEGSSALNPLVPEQTSWSVRATADDPISGGRADLSQGVRIRLLANNCPL